MTAAQTAAVRAEVEKEIGESIRRQVEEKMGLEIKIKDEKLAEARKAELKLREEKLRLDEERKSFEVEKQRQLDTERERIRAKTLEEFSETHRLKDLEKEKQLTDMKRRVEELQQQMSQGSQQLQGEVLELDLEAMLRLAFPFDEIKPVEKGVRGADIVQTVRTNHGNTCGVILWEMKRTKTWSDGWTTKLKDDLRSAGANEPVIITTALPKEMKTEFGYFDGVWVCSPKLIQPMAELLRRGLIGVAKEKHSNQNKGDKAVMVYEYLNSHVFGQQIQNIVETYREAQEQIQRERAAFEKIWRTREAQNMRIITSAASVYGQIQGMVGPSLPSIKGLDLLEEGE